MASTVFEKMTDEDIEFLKNALRQATVKWPGRAECLRRAREKRLERISKNGKEIFKYYWKCAACLDWFRDVNQMEVDHIVEVGPFCGDWNIFIPKLFCGQNNLQCLCQICHLKKTRRYASARSKWKRKPKS